MAFRGGVKFSNKKLNKSPISYDFIPGRVSYPCLGGELLVRVGGRVIAGQPIATADSGFTVHTAVCGQVESIDNSVVTVCCTDEENDFVNLPQFDKDISVDNRNEMIKYIAKAGIYLDSEPLFEVLNRSIENKVTRLVINCMECLPNLSCQYRTLLQYPFEVVNGAKILLTVLGIRTGIFAIEKNKKKLASVIEKQKYDKQMFIISLMPSKYPADHPKMIADELFYQTTYDKILTVTPSLCLQLYDAFVHSIPYLGQTVSVICGKHQENLYLPSGSMIEEVEEFIASNYGNKNDGYGYAESRAIINSPLNGYSVESDVGYITPDIKGIILYSYRDSFNRQAGVCIGCGRCGEVCPAELEPDRLYHAIKKSDYKMIAIYGIDKCIACGCCSYVCPSSLDHIRLIKDYKENTVLSTLSTSSEKQTDDKEEGSDEN